MSEHTTVIQKNDVATPEQSVLAVSASEAMRQQTWRNIGLVIAREYKNYVVSRVFVITTTVMLLLVAMGACVPTLIQFFTAHSATQTQVVVVNNAGPVAGEDTAVLARSIGTTLNGSADQTQGQQVPFVITTRDAGALKDLRKQVQDGSLGMLLTLDRTADQSIHFTYYTHVSATDDGNLARVQALTQQLNFLDTAHRLGLTASQTSRLFVSPDLHVVSEAAKQDNRAGGDIVAGYIIAYAGNILVYLAVMLYGVGVAVGVGEEKGSRIMEILVNAATPFQLMVGKIVGIGAAGLTQMAGIVGVGIGALLLQRPLHALLLGTASGAFTVDITGVYLVPLLLMLAYFLLGFLLYSTLYAALGALVKRQDEVQAAVQPVSFLLMIGYLVSYVAIYLPDTTWVKIMSYVPFWSPTLMLARVGVGGVAWWEVALTLGLMVITFLICAIVSARIYRMGVLMYGQKPNFKQLAKWVTAR